MSTLKELSNDILTEKTTKIIPENIKKDIQIFDITGTYEGSGGGGSGDIKLFKTVEEMQADPEASEGDLAVVYRSEIQSIEENSIFSSCTFPSTVTLDTAFTGHAYGSFRSVDPNVFDTSANVSPSSFRFRGYGDEEIRIEYSSSDGITYTRTDGGDETIDFGTDIKFEAMMEPWNDVFGQFMKIGGKYFDGLYEYKQKGQYGIPYNFRIENNTLLYDIIPFDVPSFAKSIGVNTKSGTLVIMKRDENGDFIGYYSNNSSGQSIVKYNGRLYYANSYGANCSYTDLSTGETTSLTNGQQVTVGSITTYIMLDTEMEDNDKLVYFIPSGGWEYNVYIDTYTLLQPSGGFRYPSYYFADTQLDATADYVYEKTFYGKNGVENGILGDVDNSYKDVSADVLVDVLTTYESFEPIIITNNSTDKAKLRSLHVLPSKQDGTALVDISALNLYSLFSTDYNLKAAYNIDVSNSPNLAYTFQSAKNLKYVSFKNSEKINYLGGTFSETGLIRGPEMNTINVTTFSSTFSFCGNLESVPNYNTSNAIYMDGTFSSCRKLKSVPNFNTINVTTMHEMFSQCDSLESVPNFDTRNLTNINEMFSGCLNLQTVPNLNLSKVTTMQTAFTGCVNLQTIPNFNTSNVVNMQMAFRGCESLNNIPNLNISKANWVGELFYNCKSLTEVPNFNTTKVESCDRMFDGCLNLVSVPSFNMSSRCNNAIMMFANCPNLSNESLNNIMYMCTKMTGLYSGNKNFSYIGITRDQANICKNLSNYSAYKSAGWSDYN